MKPPSSESDLEGDDDKSRRIPPKLHKRPDQPPSAEMDKSPPTQGRFVAATLRRRGRKGGDGAPVWMTTYLDVTTLLLVFLVLMLASADFREKAFGVMGLSGYQGDSTKASSLVDSRTGTSLVRFLTLYDLQGYVQIVTVNGEDVFRFLDPFAFKAGDYELSQAQRDRLYLIKIFAIDRLIKEGVRLRLVAHAADEGADGLTLAGRRVLSIAEGLAALHVPLSAMELRIEPPEGRNAENSVVIYAVDD